MFVLGITGGIACGKSTLAGLLRDKGALVLDADQISHDVTKAGGAAINEIIDVFGPEYIREDKSLDREKMAELVFQDKAKLDALSFIIHRHVMHTITKEVEAARKRKEKLIVLDVPIPVKEGFLDTCDQVWLVWSSEPIRMQRLADRGMEEEDAKRRILLQMSEEEYEKISDRKIMNDGTIEDLAKALDTCIQEELYSRGISLKA